MNSKKRRRYSIRQQPSNETSVKGQSGRTPAANS